MFIRENLKDRIEVEIRSKQNITKRIKNIFIETIHQNF